MSSSCSSEFPLCFCDSGVTGRSPVRIDNRGAYHKCLALFLYCSLYALLSRLEAAQFRLSGGHRDTFLAVQFTNLTTCKTTVSALTLLVHFSHHLYIWFGILRAAVRPPPSSFYFCHHVVFKYAVCHRVSRFSGTVLLPVRMQELLGISIQIIRFKNGDGQPPSDKYSNTFVTTIDDTLSTWLGELTWPRIHGLYSQLYRVNRYDDGTVSPPTTPYLARCTVLSMFSLNSGIFVSRFSV
ncbi:hypothetical protein F5I97DRAFT_501155 [Phlebopus sp. FC_14]|nr:hypothetical protein F5I97DRAFT_501155 [Phlebopus sp. FC_14]